MYEVLSVLIVLSAVLFLLLPLFRKKNSEEENAPKKNVEILEKKNILEKNISELEFDYESGKIPERDYAVMREEYERELNALLKN